MTTGLEETQEKQETLRHRDIETHPALVAPLAVELDGLDFGGQRRLHRQNATRSVRAIGRT